MTEQAQAVDDASTAATRRGAGAAADLATRWDGVYAQGETTRSWYQRAPTQSLRMLELAGIGPGAALIDVGGGASTLVDALLGRGIDVTVLDVSAAGLAAARRRLGSRAGDVDWVVSDVRDYEPARMFDAWHDRALLHFLTDPADRVRYRQVLTAATTTGAVAVLATFAPDGPDHCSGLPVARYDAPALAAFLAGDWELLGADREVHTTPAGGEQAFTWTAFRRLATGYAEAGAAR